MFDGGGGTNPGASVVEHRNALLEELQAVDVDSLAPEQLGAELKFIRASVDLLELQTARRVAAGVDRLARLISASSSPGP